MVYKKYIRRGGKRYGPYYYESYRDENGIPRTRKVDKPENNVLKFVGLILLASLLFISFSKVIKKDFSSNITGYFTGAGSGTSGDPYNITNCTQLQEMENNRTADYELVNDIDCSDTINWNNANGDGFDALFSHLRTVILPTPKALARSC